MSQQEMIAHDAPKRHKLSVHILSTPGQQIDALGVNDRGPISADAPDGLLPVPSLPQVCVWLLFFISCFNLFSLHFYKHFKFCGTLLNLFSDGWHCLGNEFRLLSAHCQSFVTEEFRLLTSAVTEFRLLTDCIYCFVTELWLFTDCIHCFNLI